MLNKIMFIAGVGIVFAGAVTVVKAIKEEQKTVEVQADDTTEEVEEISFKEAAKRKVSKIYRGFITFAFTHLDDIKTWTSLVSLVAAVVGLSSSIRSNMSVNKQMETLKDIQNDLKSVKCISSRTWLMSCDNNFTGNMLIESMCPATYTTESTLIKAHDTTVKSIDMIKACVSENLGGVACQTK